MKSRLVALIGAALLAIATALVLTGCSQAPPAPTVNGAAVEASAAAAAAAAAALAVRGTETSLTVGELASKLKDSSLTVTRPGAVKAGLFLPATYEPVIADDAFIQTYRFKSAKEARGAASTVTTNGAVLGSTPDQLINVNWTGEPSFFRNGDLIVIFVSEKPAKKWLDRDTRVFGALKSVMGKPFAGTFLDSPGDTSTASPH